MPIVKLRPTHNALLDLLVERQEAFNQQLQRHMGHILAELGVPPGSQVDLTAVVHTRQVVLPDPPPKLAKAPVPEPEIEKQEE